MSCDRAGLRNLAGVDTDTVPRWARPGSWGGPGGDLSGTKQTENLPVTVPVRLMVRQSTGPAASGLHCMSRLR